jgi:hypothetical protein
VALEAPPELTPPTPASLKTFSMRLTLQPNGLGKLIQRRRLNGAPGTGDRATMALAEAAQPFGRPLHPVSR